MPRTREFDPDEALLAAMHTFWAKGYDSTSMDDLVAATGVSRYGLYGVFGNKWQLFVASLERYMDSVVSARLAETEVEGASLDGVKRFFAGFVEALEAMPDLAANGCLVCNTAAELVTVDPRASEHVDSYFERVRLAFERALTTAKERGELREDAHPAWLASLLLSTAVGLSVQIKTARGRELARETITQTIALLDEYSTD